MKNIKYFIALALTIGMVSMSAQEKKIKFNKGLLKICSSKNFQIEGYDGDEVIIKALHDKKDGNILVRGNGVVSYAYSKDKEALAKVSKRKDTTKKGKWTVEPGATVVGYSTSQTGSKNGIVFRSNNNERKKGLKKLGEKSNNEDLGIYFTIEQKGDMLIFKDQQNVGLVMVANQKYEVKIPNTLKLDWKTGSCTRPSQNNSYVFYSSKASTLKNFEGEVLISSTLNHTNLTDVTGPVSINTIGGNVTVKFDKKMPTELYSIYTNNGFIDIEFPKRSSLMLDIVGKSVYSDMDFEVLSEEEVDDVWQKTTKMKLKNGSGKVKMKLMAGFGEVFLREKK